jgi:hypothetical protein
VRRTNHVRDSPQSERRVTLRQAELTAVRDQAKQETEAALTPRVREKEERIASMQRQIEDLKRKAEQGSQQLQGEVQELALEALLRQRFTRDLIEPVPKGEFGGDLVQRVVGPTGQICGSILWEAKRTKNWSDGWLGKLREDQRAAKADVALIVSHALPKGLQTFDYIDGIWVTDPKCALAVAVALRESLLAISAARLAGEGQQTKMDMIYRYLTGPRFRHRIEAVVERFTEMQADLDRERKAMTRLWAKREEQIQRGRRDDGRPPWRPAGDRWPEHSGDRGARCRCSAGRRRAKLRSEAKGGTDPAGLRRQNGPALHNRRARTDGPAGALARHVTLDIIEPRCV